MEGQQPIRVAHIVGKMVGGGVEAFIMNYYRNIDRTKVQFDFIIDSDSTIVPREEIEKMGGRVIEIPPYQKIFSYIKELKNILNENKYKIVHSHLNSLSVFPLFGAYLAQVPVRIAHNHSTTNKKEWKKNIIKSVLKPFSKVFATHYFACSEHAGRWLFGNKIYEKGKVQIICNAIDVEKFKFNEELRIKMRKDLKISNKFVIGHVGRFVEQKNHKFLIDVFEKIYKERNDAYLLLIGEGPLEVEIRKKVKDMHLENAVCFLGVRNNVCDFMQAIDVFAFPSLYEGLGIALIEAQATGLNCISSNNIPNEAIILDTFIKCENDTIFEWKDKILKNCESNNRLEKNKVIETTCFNINKSVRFLEELYERLEMNYDR